MVTGHTMHGTAVVSVNVASFIVVAAVVIVTPGPDAVLTIRNTLLGGRRGGAMTALGVAVGQTVWVLATSVGLATVLAASEPAFIALRVFGAGYLIYLGAQALLAAWWRKPATCCGETESAGRLRQSRE
jgi:threonine/homoserine/homoserine lactone efflux protein